MGHFNTPNSSLSDPTLSYKSGLGVVGGGGVEGGLGWFGVFWGGLGCFYGPLKNHFKRHKYFEK